MGACLKWNTIQNETNQTGGSVTKEELAKSTGNTFTCCECGQTYEKDWPDEDALAESDALWGQMDTEWAIICDDCFKANDHVKRKIQ